MCSVTHTGNGRKMSTARTRSAPVSITPVLANTEPYPEEIAAYRRFWGIESGVLTRGVARGTSFPTDDLSEQETSFSRALNAQVNRGF